MRNQKYLTGDPFKIAQQCEKSLHIKMFVIFFVSDNMNQWEILSVIIYHWSTDIPMQAKAAETYVNLIDG